MRSRGTVPATAILGRALTAARALFSRDLAQATASRFKLAERRRSLRWQVVTGAEIVARVEAEGTQLTKWTTATIGRARMIQIELGIQPLCCRLEDAAGRHGQQKCI